MVEYNPVIIIDAFLKDDNTINVFKEFINSIKDVNIPIMLSTNSIITPDILSLVDYCIYDKNNRLLCDTYDNPEIFIYDFYSSVFHIKIPYTSIQKHCLSVHINLYNALSLAKNMGFTHFFRFEYDGLVGENLLDSMRKSYDLIKEKDKKGIFIASDYIMYHYWFCEIDFFQQKFLPILNESDYIDNIKILNEDNSKSFINAERYLYKCIKDSIDSLIIISFEDEIFPIMFKDCYLNKLKTETDLGDGFFEGIYSGVSKITNSIGELIENKVCIVTINVSSNKNNTSVFNINGVEMIHNVSGTYSWCYNFIDLTDEDSIINIKINDNFNKNVTINKNNYLALEANIKMY